ncbi:gluconate 2-dehydrogenase subunit 3 family protein [Citricoccus sp. GCM10030269]|uniref:gluconate 2-dehydrogenase subunit 3 family protein n=1 Tax=Citricoccus sp. GCM10030269 TaxID=3273388 RepID=UPI003606D9D6
MAEERNRTFLGATISRRSMLSTPMVLGGLALAGCSPDEQGVVPEEGSILDPERTPVPPASLQDDEELLFFSEDESSTLRAMVARIIPGDDDDPGALQAGVPTYIDRKLDGFETFAEPTYTEGPFASEYENGQEPVSQDESSVAVPAAEMYRYGFQSQMRPQELYRSGLAGLDRLAQTRYGRRFAELSEQRQDELLMVLDGVQQRAEGGGGDTSGGGTGGGGESGGGSGPTDAEMDQAEELFREADPGGFFSTVRTDTIEGMFADPEYGGNRNLVGWALIGWPGAQRSYSPQEMLHGTDKQPTSMKGLTPMNPDRAGLGEDAIEQPQHGVHNH